MSSAALQKTFVETCLPCTEEYRTDVAFWYNVLSFRFFPSASQLQTTCVPEWNLRDYSRWKSDAYQRCRLLLVQAFSVSSTRALHYTSAIVMVLFRRWFFPMDRLHDLESVFRKARVHPTGELGLDPVLGDIDNDRQANLKRRMLR